VRAAIKNFQIRIPLAAEAPHTQILNLSLMSDLTYEMKKIQKSGELVTSSSGSFDIS